MPLPEAEASLLSEDLRNNEVIGRYNSVEELARGHVETRGKMSSMVSLPGDDATDDQWNEYHARLAPAEYQYKAPEGSGAIKEDMLKGYGEVAKKAGLTGRQFQTLADWFSTDGAQHMRSEYQMTKEEGLAAFKELAGTEAPAQLANMDRGLAFLKAKDPKLYADFQAFVEDTGLGNHPVYISMLAEYGAAVAEDTQGPGAGPQDGTVGDARALIQEMGPIKKGGDGCAGKTPQKRCEKHRHVDRDAIYAAARFTEADVT